MIIDITIKLTAESPVDVAAMGPYYVDLRKWIDGLVEGGQLPRDANTRWVLCAHKGDPGVIEHESAAVDPAAPVAVDSAAAVVAGATTPEGAD